MSQPTWMKDHEAQLKHLAIGDLMLVAAHDASAYRQYDGLGDENMVTSATFTQEETLLGQLQYGVRFLDIRIGYCTSSLFSQKLS